MNRSDSPFQLRSRTSIHPLTASANPYNESLLSSSSYLSQQARRPTLTSSPILPSPHHRSSLLNRSCRRPKLLISFFTFLILGAYWLHYSRDWLVLLRFKYRNHTYDQPWYNSNRCGLRKKPLIFVKSQESISIIWESNCERSASFRAGIAKDHHHSLPSSFSLRSSSELKKGKGTVHHWDREKVKRRKVAENRVVYSVDLLRLQGGEKYVYEIGWSKSSDLDRELGGSLDGFGESDGLLEEQDVELLARHEFTWTGIASGTDHDEDDQELSSRRPSSKPLESTTIHIAALADNQFNVRTFHRILVNMLKYAASLPSKRSTPDLIFHAGDQVQNPHNLAQWQTDFWDAMTSVLPSPLGQTTPMVLARGNHDWDKTGVNVFTGGSPPRLDWTTHFSIYAGRVNHPGTFFAYSPHPRCRIIVLDSNLNPADQEEQEDWLIWEMGKSEWTDASFRIVMVHVPPFLEYWDKKAWTIGKESHWSIYVRHRLAPLWSQQGAHLVLSGHSHAYSRGFLPASLHRAFSSVSSSEEIEPFARAIIAERGWEKRAISNDGVIEESGTIYAVFGGAGGTLDEDQVEDWGFYEKSVMGKHHFGWLSLGFAGDADERGVIDLGEEEKVAIKKRRIYRIGKRCEQGEESVIDLLEWRAVGIDKKVFDAFRIEAEGCKRK